MDTLSTRALTSQLADDFAWLEQHARQQDPHGPAAGRLRLAAALVRNCIGPYLDDQPPTPLHVVVVGGAGAGKSTVTNMLCGAVVAEANPIAGYTRHPIAYTSSTGPLNWAAHLGFLGPLARLTQPSPSRLDQDIYQVRRVPADGHSSDLLRDWVVWDCPDMTTWAAEAYIPRLLEAAALGDVLVYAASDERYNDQIPTQFLQLFLEAGKPVVCCLLKMSEANAQALVDDFRKKVLEAMPGGLGKQAVEVLAIPYFEVHDPNDLIRAAAKWRIGLLNQVSVLGGVAMAARKRSVQGACRFLTHQQQSLLDVARSDVQALDNWSALVKEGQKEFDVRYKNEYLATEKFRGFDEALVKLMQLLEVPGLGGLVSGALNLARMPGKLLWGFLRKSMFTPDAPTRPEQPTLEEALTGWIDMLHTDVARRAGDHELWQHLNQAFHSGELAAKTRERFQQVYRDFQTSLAQEVNRTAQGIYERLEKKPLLLNSLRTGKFVIDAGTIGVTVAAGGIGLHDVVMVPVVAWVTQQLVEVLGKQVVDDEREKTRTRQQTILHEQLSTPLAEWLTRWPATGGSAFERLHLALGRLPGAIANLDARVRNAGR